MPNNRAYRNTLSLAVENVGAVATGNAEADILSVSNNKGAMVASEEILHVVVFFGTGVAWLFYPSG